MKKLTKEEIHDLVKRWNMEIHTDGKRIRGIMPPDDVKDVISAHKEEIMDYLVEEKARRETERKKQQEEFERHCAIVEAIPGVKELRNALRAYSEYWTWFDIEWARGNASTFWYPDKVTGEDLKKLVIKYPDAAFVVKVGDVYERFTSKIYELEREAYDKIGNGVPVEIVREEFYKKLDAMPQTADVEWYREHKENILLDRFFWNQHIS